MKPYGIPRLKDLECPDCADIRNFGLKSSKSRARGKGGEFKNSFRSSTAKRRTRQIWKSRARSASKALCIEE